MNEIYRCPNCSYMLVLLERRSKYKCAKCGKLFFQKDIETEAFRNWNEKQRETDLHNLRLERQRPKLSDEEREQKRKEYYKENKEKIFNSMREWRKNNVERKRQCERISTWRKKQKFLALQELMNNGYKPSVNGLDASFSTYGLSELLLFLLCVIPKLFHKADLISFMKLNKTKLIETLRRLNEGKTVYQARKVAGISVRRVYHIKNEYHKTGKIPEIGRNIGRPRKNIEQWEIETVKETYEKYRVSADTLERLIERDYKKYIGHNRIHKILVLLGYAKKKDKKDIRKKKWKRYERKHSLTAVHIDWHYFKGTWVFGVEDDASRKLLAMIERNRESTESSIIGMETALKHGQIKQCISDHGSEFTSNFVDADSKFRDYLKLKNIKQILCRIKHPQSNGKIEKWFDCYDRHRKAFKTAEEFVYWYNDLKPHKALNFDELETPSQAFIRKMRK